MRNCAAISVVFCAGILTANSCFAASAGCDVGALDTAVAGALDHVLTAPKDARRTVAEAGRQVDACGALRSREGLRLYNALSEVNRGLKRGKEAEHFARVAAETAAEVMGQDSVERAVSLESLALALAAQRRYVEAEPLVREAMTIVRTHGGEESLFQASLLNTLAALHYGLGDFDGARRQLQRASSITRRHPGSALGEGVERSLNSLAAGPR